MKKTVAVALSAIMLMTPSNILGRVKEKTYYIEAEPGYRVVDVLVNGKSVGPVESYTFKDFDGTQTLKVITEKIINNYTVTFSPNGGTGEIPPQVFKEGEEQNLPKNTFQREGYVFKGWSTIPTDKEPQYTDQGKYTATGNVILHAIWLANTYQIEYNLDGGTVSGNPLEYTADTNTITLINPTKVGNTFKGWTGSNGTTPSTNVTIPKGSIGNKEYTANWIPDQYTITFNPNTGVGETKTQIFTYGIPQKLTPNTFTKENMVLAGWSTTSTGNVELKDGQEYSATKTLTLYAIWKERPKYPVTTYEPENVEITPEFEPNSSQSKDYEILNYIIEEGNATVEEI